MLDDFKMLTIFDEEISPRPLPARYDSGADPTFTIYDGVSRGVAVLARFSWWRALLGFKVEPFDGDLTIELGVKLDDVTHAWWLRKHEESGEAASRTPRHIVIRCQGVLVGGFTISGEEQRLTHSFVVKGEHLSEGGLLMLDFEAFDGALFERATNDDPLRGLELTYLDISEHCDPLPGQRYTAADDAQGQFLQGCVVTGASAQVLRFTINEQPRLSPNLNKGNLRRIIGRGVRKVGVLRRAKVRAQAPVVSSDALAAAFRITTQCADGAPMEPQLRLTADDVLEVSFPPAADGQSSTVFYELSPQAAGLQALGFAEHVRLATCSTAP